MEPALPETKSLPPNPPPPSPEIPPPATPPPSDISPQPTLNSLSTPELTAPDEKTLITPGSPTKTGGSKLPLIILIVFFVFGALLAGSAYAIAYEKIKIGNPQIEKQISNFVQGLPFTPKTPKYLLTSAAKAHQKISQHRFDLSVAAESDSFTSSLGMNKVDIQIVGAVDYSDLNNPKLALNASLTKDFNIDIKKPDKMIYFKINKVPPLLVTALGFNQGPELNSVLENWASYDTSTLETEARKSLEENKKSTSFTNQFAEKTIDNLLEEKILKLIKVTSETIDGFKTYRLDLSFDKELLDTLDENLQNQVSKEKSFSNKSKLSDYISDLTFNLWIDKGDYYVRKISTSFKAKSGNIGTMDIFPLPIMGNLTQGTTSFSGVLKLSNFQEPVSVERPDKSIPYDEYFRMLMEQSQTYKPQGLDRSRDATRKTDASELLNAIERFYVSHQCYPWSWASTNGCSDRPIQLNKGNFIKPSWGAGDNLQVLIDTNELKPQFRERISSFDNPSSNRLFLIEHQWTSTSAGQVFVCFEPESEAGRKGELGRLSSANGSTGKCDGPYSGGTSINPDSSCLVCVPQ